MKTKYEIEKDLILKKWVVWEKHRNYSIDRYHARTKLEAKGWTLLHGKKNKRNVGTKQINVR